MSRTTVQDICVSVEASLNCCEASEVKGGGVAVGIGVPVYGAYGYPYGPTYGNYGYDNCYTPSYAPVYTPAYTPGLYLNYSKPSRGWNGGRQDFHHDHHHHGGRGFGRGRRW